MSIISHRLFKIILKLRLQIWFPLNNQEETFLCLYYYVQAPFVIINVGRGRFFCQTRNDLSMAKGVVLIRHGRSWQFHINRFFPLKVLSEKIKIGFFARYFSWNCLTIFIKVLAFFIKGFYPRFPHPTSSTWSHF